MRELLLLLCHYPFEEKNRDTLANLLGEVTDWPELVRLLNAHGILALAAYNIKEAGLEKIPAEAMAILENGYLLSVARNAWLTECWKEVNAILCNAGIKHILLKGMVLEHTLYGSRGLRQMNDNDIFIQHEDSFKAWQLLQKEGFTVEPLKSPLFRKITAHINQHLPTLYKNGYAIEIHDKLFENRKTEGKSICDPFINALEVFVADTKALILSKELHLIYLIRHFEGHTIAGDCQLRLYNDIILLDRFNAIKMPDRFISDPMQGNRKEFRKAAYKARIRAIPQKHRLRFLIGDTFPSPRWMKERYKCSLAKAMLRYPIRIGKLMWLIN